MSERLEWRYPVSCKLSDGRTVLGLRVVYSFSVFEITSRVSDPNIHVEKLSNEYRSIHGETQDEAIWDCPFLIPMRIMFDWYDNDYGNILSFRHEKIGWRKDYEYPRGSRIHEFFKEYLSDLIKYVPTVTS